MALDKKLTALLNKAVKNTNQGAISDSLQRRIGEQQAYDQKYFRHGGAADEYIAQNPSAGYDIIDSDTGAVTGRQEATRDYGLLGNIGYGIVSPFLNLGQMAGDLTNSANAGNTLLGEGERRRLEDNPLAFTGQQLAGAAGTLIPVGGASTLLGQVGRGGVAGLLSGASQTDLEAGGDIMGDALKGAAFGGGITGALGLAGRGVQKLRAGKQLKDVSQGAVTKGGGVADALKFNEADDFLTNAEKLARLSEKGAGKLNKNQAKGIAQQYRSMGFTTRKGDLTYAKGFADDVAKIEKAREFFGLPRSNEGMSELASRVGAMREGVLDTSDKLFVTNLDEIGKQGANTVSLATNNALSPGKAREAIKTRLEEIMVSLGVLPEMGIETTQTAAGAFRYTPAALTLRAGDLQTIKKGVTEGFLRVAQKGSKSADDMIDDQIYQWANQNLKTVPGYKPLNEVFETLYTQNPGLRRTADTSLLGAQTASVNRSPGALAMGVLEKGQGKIREGIGNIQAGLSGGADNAIQGGVVTGSTDPYNRILENIGRLPKEQQAQAMQNLTNILPGAARQGSGIAKEMLDTMGGNIFNLRPQLTAGEALTAGLAGAQRVAPLLARQIVAGEVPAEQAAALDELSPLMAEQQGGGMDMGMGGSQMGFGAPQGMDRQMALNQALQMTGGKMNSSTLSLAKFLMEGSGTDGGGKQIPAERLQQLSDMQNALSELDNLRGVIQEEGAYFGPIQGGALGDIAQGLGLGGSRARIQTLTNTLAQVLGKALEGGKLTDSDIQRYRQMLPSMNDNPQDALLKLDQIQGQLERQLTNQGQNLQGAGYNASAFLPQQQSMANSFGF